MRSFNRFGFAVSMVSGAAIVAGAALTGYGQGAAPQGRIEFAPDRPGPRIVGSQDGYSVTYAVAAQPAASQLLESSADLERRTEALVAKYGEAAKDDDREKIKAELAELLDKQFAVQQQIREEEVAQIEARVKKLRELIEKRKDARQSIIEKRLDQLLREAEGLGWNAGGEGAHRAVYRAPLALPTRVEATKTSASPSAK